jgi:hypothetical protein
LKVALTRRLESLRNFRVHLCSSVVKSSLLGEHLGEVDGFDFAALP